MKCLFGLVFVIGAALAFDKQAWITPMGNYAHFNEKNEIIIEADCNETPNTRFVSKLFPEPTNTQIAQAISNGQDPTPFLDPLCYEKQDPEVWKTLDNLVFSGKPCGVEIRMDMFEKIAAFGNQKCDHGCNLAAIEAAIQANWNKIQPFYDFLNDWIKNSIHPWSYDCATIIQNGIIAVRDAVVNSGNCKQKALDKFLDRSYGFFDNDELNIESGAHSMCTTLRLHKDDYAHGIAQVIMSNMLVVGIE